jgi:hypothetical protein
LSGRTLEKRISLTDQVPPEDPLRSEAEAELLKESISLLRGREVTSRRKLLSDWPLLTIVRRTKTDRSPF